MPPPARGCLNVVKAGVTGISVNHYNSTINKYDNIYYRIYGMR